MRFLEACQLYGDPKWRSTKAAGEKGRDLGREVKVRVNHSNKSFCMDERLCFLMILVWVLIKIL